jgi:molybdopterin molybdotransferase
VADLIPIAEARRRVLAAVVPLDEEDVPLEKALGRVLAEDVKSAISVPPFDSSAMDGYAVVAGPAAELDVIGEARAGHPAMLALRPGAAIRISTGAALPSVSDSVVPLERAVVRDGRVEVPETTPGENVRRAGEDVTAGQVVLERRSLLGPAELGVAASVGRAGLRCSRRPRVALVVTGDELTDPGERLGPGRIYSSNAFALAAQVDRAGGEVVLRETARDTAEGTRAALARALAAADLVIVSGGVSVGPHDHVKDSLRELGVEQEFWGVSLRPGKPTWFGTRAGAPVFGLPGNPVSAMVTFHLFARPALAALQGAEPSIVRLEAVLDEGLPRIRGREHAVRVRLQARDGGFRAVSTGEQGSHVLSSMLGADGLALIPPGQGEEPAGRRVAVELL